MMCYIYKNTSNTPTHREETRLFDNLKIISLVYQYLSIQEQRVGGSTVSNSRPKLISSNLFWLIDIINNKRLIARAVNLSERTKICVITYHLILSADNHHWMILEAVTD